MQYKNGKKIAEKEYFITLTELNIVAIAARRFSNFSSGESAACRRDKYWDIVCSALSDGGVIFDCNKMQYKLQFPSKPVEL